MKKIHFLTFLAPNMKEVYESIVDYIGRHLRVDVDLTVGQKYDEVFDQSTHFAFICGLPYVMLDRQRPGDVEPLAAPILDGERYQERPIYFSDVIVRRESGVNEFGDLRGKTWAYNEPESQSGYGIVRQKLIELGEIEGFFGEVIQSGWHEESIRWVRDGRIDASAIDSQVLAVAMRDDPSLQDDLKVINALGPSTIQPLVRRQIVPTPIKESVLEVLTGISKKPEGRELLMRGFIDRFVPVTASDYDDIREMLANAERAQYLDIR